MAVGDPADRVTEDLDRRLRDVLVVIRGTSLAKVLELPGFFRAGLHVRSRPNTREGAKLLKPGIGPRSAAEKDSGVRIDSLRYDTPQMRVYDPVHRPVEGLARLHPAVEQPPPP